MIIIDADIEHSNHMEDSYCCPHCLESHQYNFHVAKAPDFTKLTCVNCNEIFAAQRIDVVQYASGFITEEEPDND